MSSRAAGRARKADETSAGKEESKAERLDRELIELLNGLRVLLPGVQVLLAVLFTVPFTTVFQRTTAVQRDIFFAAVLAATASSICLIAPSAHHRLLWRQHDKEQLLETANQLAIAGTGFLAVSMTCVVFVITDMIFSSPAAAAVAGMNGLLSAWVWFAMPLSRRTRRDSDS